MPNPQFAKLPQAKKTLENEHICLVCLEGAPVGVGLSEVDVAGIAVAAEHDDVHVGIGPSASDVGRLHRHFIVSFWEKSAKYIYITNYNRVYYTNFLI